MGSTPTLFRQHGVPYTVDLGRGTLVDLTRWGLPAAADAGPGVAQGAQVAQVVTFSGDKLLGGPQAGLIVGDKALIARIKRNPLKPVLRLNKMKIAALEVALKLCRDPDSLAQRLPTLRLLSRPAGEIRALAERLLPTVALALGARASVQVLPCRSQIAAPCRSTAWTAPAWHWLRRPACAARAASQTVWPRPSSPCRCR